MPSPIGLSHEGDECWHVELGPIPDLPAWHEQSKPISYPFPTEAAAEGFAATHRSLEPDREVTVVPPAEVA